MSTGSHSAGVEIGDHALFGPNVAIVCENYRYRSLDVPVDEQGVTSIGIRIGRNVWVGAKSLPMASGQSECDERLRVRRLAAVDRARARGDDRHILLAVGAEIGDRHRVRAEL